MCQRLIIFLSFLFRTDNVIISEEVLSILSRYPQIPLMVSVCPFPGFSMLGPWRPGLQFPMEDCPWTMCHGDCLHSQPASLPKGLQVLKYGPHQGQTGTGFKNSTSLPHVGISTGVEFRFQSSGRMKPGLGFCLKLCPRLSSVMPFLPPFFTSFSREVFCIESSSHCLLGKLAPDNMPIILR